MASTATPRTNSHPEPLRTRMLQGAGMAFGATVLGMLAGRGGSDLTIAFRGVAVLAATLGGAMGGAAWYVLDPLRASGGARKTVANVLSLLAYAAAALGAVLLAAFFVLT